MTLYLRKMQADRQISGKWVLTEIMTIDEESLEKSK